MNIIDISINNSKSVLQEISARNNKFEGVDAKYLFYEMYTKEVKINRE